MKKSFIAVSAAAAAMLSSAVYAQDITVTVDGKNVEFDQPPVIENDRTLVPMRAIFEALGAQVEWDEESRTVTSVRDSHSVSLTIDSDIMTSGDEEIKLDVPAKIINDRTMIPVRAVSEAMDCIVDWDAQTQTVIITNPVSTEAPAAPSAAPTSSPESSPAAADPSASPAASAMPLASPAAADIEDNVNIFTDENLTAGKLLDGTKDTLSDNNAYCVTDYIPINAQKSYYAGYYDPNACSFKTGYCVNYAFYDANKTYISGANADMSKPVQAPESASYIRYSIKLDSAGRAIRYITFMQTDKAPESFKKSEYFAADAQTSAFEDKKIFILGDAQVSNGANWLLELEKALNPNIIQAKTNNYYRYSADGSSSSLTGSSFINSLPNDADFIIVFSGLYDWQASYSIGDTELMSGGVFDFASMAKSKWNDIPISFVTMPLYKNAADGFTSGGLYNTRGMTSVDYSQAIKDAAEIYDINIIDLSDLWTADNMSEYLNTSSLSYLYPNDEGAKLIAEKIADALMSQAQ